MSEVATRSPEAIAAFDDYRKRFKKILGTFVKPEILNNPRKTPVLQVHGLTPRGVIERLSDRQLYTQAEFGGGRVAIYCPEARFSSQSIELDFYLSGESDVHTLLIDFEAGKYVFIRSSSRDPYRIYNLSFANRDLHEKDSAAVIQEASGLLAKAAGLPHKFFLADSPKRN